MSMKQTTQSTFAIVLALAAWPISYYGFTQQWVDYARGTPVEYIIEAQNRATCVIAVGLLCVFGALWFSGKSFVVAKARSLSALGICFAYFAVLVYTMWT
jgi:hypothetical protein